MPRFHRRAFPLLVGALSVGGLITGLAGCGQSTVSSESLSSRQQTLPRPSTFASGLSISVSVS